jgi:predicted nucleic acid-binding protein
MYLLDTNIWLELLLNQEKSKEVECFLNLIKDSEIFISSFSLFSICILLSKLKKYDTLVRFVDDLFDNDVEVININFNEIKNIIEIEKNYNLDFDDAFQYYVSLSYELTLISYDKDFDRTPNGRITPGYIMNK